MSSLPSSEQQLFNGFCLHQLGMAPSAVQRTLENWLHEDCGHGDLTVKGLGNLLDGPSVAQIVAKQDCVVAGLPLAVEIFRLVQGTTQQGEFSVLKVVEEKTPVTKGTVLLSVKGNGAALLLGERTALNLLSRLCGVATYTAAVVERLRKLSLSTGGGATPRLMETRKTTPGLKIYEKYATRAGGAHNHRMGLDAGAMLKENHFAAGARAGLDFLNTILRVKAELPLLAGLEIEVTNLEEFKIALGAGVPVIMLDNFSLADAARAVALRNESGSHALLEISGNLDRLDLAEVVQTGVDLMSMGALIHQATWMDLSLRFESIAP
jgi:nicotinate-nucleotide pyrophosphorylase (carboxylating)